MEMPAVLLTLLGVLILMAILMAIDQSKRSKMSPDERKKHDDKLKGLQEDFKWGQISPEYICPHCQIKGQVHTQSVTRKKGISGAKATGAVLTLGVSVLATGLSRKEGLTQAHCCNCNSTWDF